MSGAPQAGVGVQSCLDGCRVRYRPAAPPRSCTASHVTPAVPCVQVVAVRTLHRSYQLKAADLTCGSMADLSVYNMRRLFALADAGLEFMSLRKDAGDGVGNRRRLRNATLEPDGSDSPPHM